MRKWFSLWGLGQTYSLADFERIKEKGFVGVEVWGEHTHAERAFEYAKKCNFEIGLHLPFHDLNLATPFEELEEFILNTMKYWIRKLYEYNGSHAVIHGGTAHAFEERHKSSQKVITRLKKLNEYAKKHNVELLFENQIPDSLNYTHVFPSEVDEWIRVLDETSTKACLDTGHLAVQGDDFKETINSLGNRLVSVHLADNDGLSDLHLMPGDGKNLTEAPLSYLKDINFKGPIVLEINPYEYSMEDILDKSIDLP